jgi:excisionase family DNA binding protein
MQGLYSTHDAALILQVHPFTVAKWIDRGVLNAWRTAGGHRRVQAADLRAYLVERGLPIPPELQSRDGRLKLLVVDDDAPTLRGLVRSFRPLEAQVTLTTTSSGVEALLLLPELRPDAMLIDVNMPDLDGYEVIRCVRKFPVLADVALVAMTAHHTREIVAETKRAGALACLAKPFDAASVLKMLPMPTYPVPPSGTGKRRGARSVVGSSTMDEMRAAVDSLAPQSAQPKP